MAREDDEALAKDYEEDAARLDEMTKKARELRHVDDSLFPEEIRKPPALNEDGGLLDEDDTDDEEDDDASELE